MTNWKRDAIKVDGNKSFQIYFDVASVFKETNIFI